jgi:hypothetical protein
MKNDIGVLFELATLVSQQGVNILAVNGAVCGEECLIRLIADDNRKALEVLAEHRFAPQEEDVVLVELPHRPAMLKQVTKAMAEAGIDIHHVYAAATSEQDQCLLVFHTSDDDDAVAKLKQSQVGTPEATDIPGEDRENRERNANMVSEGGPDY